MEKPCWKCTPKASPKALFNFVNNPKQPLHARNSFKNKIFWKRVIKKLTLFFVLSSVVFNGQENYEKQKSPETSN